MAEEIAYILDKNRLRAVARETDSDVSDNIFATVLDKTAFAASAIIARFQSGGGGVTLFLELTDTPNSYTGQAGRAAIVNPGETALIFSRMEPYLGVPAADGYVLSSTVAGVRSWIPPGGAGTVASVFGRTGSVVAVSGDYNADQISQTGTTNKFATTAQLNQIATNTGNISTNAAGIANNAANIATNTTDIANNVTAIATKENSLGNPAGNGYLLASTTGGVRSWVDPATIGGVTSVFGRTGVVVATSGDYNADQIDDAATTNKFATQAELDQIATNTGNIATNTSDIADNAADIATNAGNIATNASNIATNTSDIATNTSAIATNASNIATNTSNIATNTSDIATNAAAIATKEDSLGNPAADGMQLVSTAAGVRSWVSEAGYRNQLVTDADSPVAVERGVRYLTDTRAGAIVFNLPQISAIPAYDSGVFSNSFVDVYESWTENNITITPNGADAIANGAVGASYVGAINGQIINTHNADANQWALDTALSPSGIRSAQSRYVKNYIKNPDGLQGIQDITADGSITVSRTVDPTELPENETKKTAIKLVNSGGSGGERVVFEAFDVDYGDNGREGTGEVYIKTLDTYADGDATAYWEDATTGEVFGETVINTSTRYISGVRTTMTAGNPINFVIEFNEGDVDGLAVSGVGTLAQNPLVGSSGGWKIYDQSVVTLASAFNSAVLSEGYFKPYKDPLTGDWYLDFVATLTQAPGNFFNITFSGITFGGSVGFAIPATSTSMGANQSIGDSKTTNGTGTISGDTGGGANIAEFKISGTNIPLASKPTWADFDDTVPLGSDLETVNAKGAFNTAAGQSIPNATWTSVTFGTTIRDELFGQFNGTTLTASNPCWIEGTFSVLWTNAFTAASFARVLVNGVTARNAIQFPANTASSKSSTVPFLDIYLNAGDTAVFQVFHSEGVARTLQANADFNWLNVNVKPAKSTTLTGFPLGPQADEYTVMKANKTQIKSLASNTAFTTGQNVITFNNLTVGKLYYIEGHVVASSITQIVLGFSQVAISGLSGNLEALTANLSIHGSQYFIATATSVSMNVVFSSGSTTLQGNGTTHKTYAILTEVNNALPTTDFT